MKAYVRQWWNWLDFIMLSLYLCTFSLRLVAYMQSHNPEYGPNIIPRRAWPENDPTLISEGVFAIANVFSFARIIYLFQVVQSVCRGVALLCVVVVDWERTVSAFVSLSV